jgi:hypothetical protein
MTLTQHKAADERAVANDRRRCILVFNYSEVDDGNAA